MEELPAWQEEVNPVEEEGIEFILQDNPVKIYGEIICVATVILEISVGKTGAQSICKYLLK
ncbi:MAG: hypothetical protein J6B76_06905 [Peptococcaceae bacterium]|nr:hypothetical protein [Peptococcaceae bacterium]